MSKQALNLEKLMYKSRKIKIHIINMIYQANSGHPAGSLGLADLFSYLYFHHLNHHPSMADREQRDRLLLSNGHVCPVWYASLAESGYFSPNLLSSFRQLNSPLQGHPVLNSIEGIENTSGSLGHGLSQAVGIAIGLKMNNQHSHVYCVMSDGEQQAGQTWEAYMLGYKYRLDNLIGIIDRNQIQIEGQTEEVMPIEPLVYKLMNFGWHVFEVDAHNFLELDRVFNEAKKIDDRPSVIIANTIPGKGVSFMEHNHHWHGKVPSEEEYQSAIYELEN